MPFTPDDRQRIRQELLSGASSDDRLSGGGLTGSAAAGREDAYSDIDLAFGVRKEVEIAGVLSDWTARMYEAYGVAHHFDVAAGSWTYRVFLLENGLQVDLAFAPEAEFGALAPTFKLVFGTAGEPPMRPPPKPDELIGLAWLYCLHGRTCIARGKLWQAEYMVSTARDHVLALACLRHGLPVREGRGMDQMPGSVKVALIESFASRLEPAELGRALAVVAEALLVEVAAVDRQLERRLTPVLRRLTE